MTIYDYGYTGEQSGTVARITSVHRERYGIAGDFGESYARLKTKEYYQEGEMFPTVGDFVIIDYIENGNIKNSVNLPNASMNAVGTKICVIHKNVPTTIASITTAVGNEGINIENMVNASKKEFAYTMLDVVGDIPASVEGKINAVDGVIRVRIIK